MSSHKGLQVCRFGSPPFLHTARGMSSEALLTARKSGIEPPTVTPTASAATKSRHQHEDRQPRRLAGDVKIGQPQGMEQK